MISVSRLGADTHETTLATRASGLAVNRGRVTDVIALAPDLVLTRGVDPNAAATARRLGIVVLELPQPETIADVRTKVRLEAAALGREIAGAAAIKRMDMALGTVPLRATPALLIGGAGLTLRADGLAAALVNLARRLAPSPYALFEVMFWLLGSLADCNLPQLAIARPVITAAGLVLLRQRRALDSLALGEDVATSLGLDMRRLRWIIVVSTGVITGSAVAVTSDIAFVGLIVPHLVRPLIGNQPGAAMVPAARAGAVMLVASDMADRVPINGQELKLGALTAIIGAPFFLWLVLKSR